MGMHNQPESVFGIGCYIIMASDAAFTDMVRCSGLTISSALSHSAAASGMSLPSPKAAASIAGHASTCMEAMSTALTGGLPFLQPNSRSQSSHKLCSNAQLSQYASLPFMIAKPTVIRIRDSIARTRTCQRGPSRPAAEAAPQAATLLMPP